MAGGWGEGQASSGGYPLWVIKVLSEHLEEGGTTVLVKVIVSSTQPHKRVC
jgi:hypothetical protein